MTRAETSRRLLAIQYPANYQLMEWIIQLNIIQNDCDGDDNHSHWQLHKQNTTERLQGQWQVIIARKPVY